MIADSCVSRGWNVETSNETNQKIFLKCAESIFIDFWELR